MGNCSGLCADAPPNEDAAIGKTNSGATPVRRLGRHIFLQIYRMYAHKRIALYTRARMCRVYSGFQKLLCKEQSTARSTRDHDPPCRGPWLRVSGAPHRRIPCPIWLYARLIVGRVGTV